MMVFARVIGIVATACLVVGFLLTLMADRGEERGVGVAEVVSESRGLREEEMFLPDTAGESVRVAKAEGRGVAVSLRVVSVLDSRRLGEAIAESVGEVEPIGRSDRDGLMEVSGRVGQPLLISASGFAPRRIWLQPSGHTRTVELYPAAELEVQLLAPNGEPRVGELVEVVPVDGEGVPMNRGELDGGSWRMRSEPAWASPTLHSSGALSMTGSQAERLAVLRESAPLEGWAQRTDLDGRASWRRLPALHGYAWGAVELELVEIEPQAPTGTTVRDDGSLEVSLDADDMGAHSGVFGLPVHTLTRLTGWSRGLASVTGVVLPISSPPSGGIVVKLFDVSSAAKTAALGYRSIDYEDGVVTADGGSFAFLDVAAGEKELRAWWREEGNQYYFVHERFELAPAEERNLGVLDPLVGASIDLEVGLTDQTGKALSLPDLMSESDLASLPELEVWFDTSGLRASEGGPLSVGVSAPWGERFTFHGWPIGGAHFSVRKILGGGKKLFDFGRFVFPQDQLVRVGDELAFHTDVVLEQLTTLHVRATCAGVLERFSGTLHLMERETQRSASLNLDDNRGGLSGEARLPAGSYSFYLNVPAVGDSASSPSWQAQGQFDLALESPGRLDMVLSPAAGAQGTLKQAGAFVNLWAVSILDRHESLLVTEADEDGHFFFTGLVPGVAYALTWDEEGSERRTTFVAGAPGSVTSVVGP